jgi:hypothetical protein
MSEPDEGHFHECECGQKTAWCARRRCDGMDTFWGECCTEKMERDGTLDTVTEEDE